MMLDDRVSGRAGVLGLAAAILLFATALPTFAVDPPQSEQQARQAILARLNALQSIIVEYNRATTYTPAMSKDEIKKLEESSLPGGGRISVKIGTDKYAGTFRALNGLARYEERLIESPMFNPLDHTIRSHLADRVECFDQGNHYDRSASEPAPDIQIDTSLGLRIFGERSTWLTPDLIKQFELDVTDANLAVLRAHRWEGKPSADQAHEWTFDRRLGYALTSYRRLVKGEVAEETTLGEYQNVSGFQLPGRIQYRTPNHRVKPPIDTETSVLRVTSYAVNDPKNTPDSYPIDRPAGVRVWDQR